MTYNELLASPDVWAAAQDLSDADLRGVRGWLAGKSGWVARRVHGICMVEESRRFEDRCDEEMGVFPDMDHGSEVGL